MYYEVSKQASILLAEAYTQNHPLYCISTGLAHEE